MTMEEDSCEEPAVLASVEVAIVVVAVLVSVVAGPT